METDKLSGVVIGCALTVHKTLGPGLLESSYEQCMAYELSQKQITFKIQHPLPIKYKGIKIDSGYRVDLLVENKIIVELKVVEKILPLHEAQILTYLKLSGIKLGLLINFNQKLLRNGIKRFAM